ncbi:MAG: hypothetical protein FJ087_21350, partial [Deltaproteobacteria bacterium]|nr:hypothetical protein [Deltaproteobacteria bacterium]
GMFAGTGTLWKSPNWSFGLSMYLPINPPAREKPDPQKKKEKSPCDPRW